MLQRLDAMESELGALIESLRTGSNRLNADLQLLEQRTWRTCGTRSRRGARSQPEGAPRQPAVVESVRRSAQRGRGAGRGRGRVEEVETRRREEPEPAARRGRGSAATASDDTEGARLIALNMALNGTPREETDRYLAENFELGDRAALLDEVYASVGG